MLNDPFSERFTRAEHEDPDIHYIGESLPKPSSVTAVGGTSTVGVSKFPAREDHLHNSDSVAYTPSSMGWTNMTASLEYTRFSKKVYLVNGVLIVTGSTGGTTNPFYFSPPFTVTRECIFSGWYYDVSAGLAIPVWYKCAPSGNIYPYVLAGIGQINNNGVSSATVPTPATGDYFNVDILLQC